MKYESTTPRIRELQTADEVELLIALFSRIAGEEGWQPGGELEAHISRSTYFGLWANEAFVGGLQIVHPEPATGNLSCHRVWPELDVQALIGGTGKIAHIAVMAIDKPWRGKNGGLFWHLAVAMWRYCVDSGITDLFLETTPSTLKCYQRLGWPLTVCGPLRMHWGEPCYLTRLNVREVAGSLTERATRSDLYHRLLLEAIQRNPAASMSKDIALI